MKLSRAEFDARGRAREGCHAHAQPAAVPVVRFVNARSPDAPLAAAFRRDLNEAGYLRTIQVCLNDLPATLWQAEGAATWLRRLLVVTPGREAPCRT